MFWRHRVLLHTHWSQPPYILFRMVKNKRSDSLDSAVFRLTYCLLCPKYRRQIPENDVDEDLKELPVDKAKSKRWALEALAITPDRDVFLRAHPKDPAAHGANQFKGYRSRVLPASSLGCALACRLCGRRRISGPPRARCRKRECNDTSRSRSLR